MAGLISSFYAGGLNDVAVPLRNTIVGEQGYVIMNVMPAYSETLKLFVAKLGTVVLDSGPSNKSVNALVTAFSTSNGCPLGVFDGDAITHLKCAAVTAHVTDACASADASIFGLIGTGVQAREQLRAVAAVRPIREVRVFSRDPSNVEKFIADNYDQHPNITFLPCCCPEDAAYGADIISTATTSREPVLSSQALCRPAVHINCFGFHTISEREIPQDVLKNSFLIVEDVETAIVEAGEVHRSAVGLRELHRVETSELQQRRTVFSSTGHAVLDLLAVYFISEKLRLLP